MDNKDNDNHYKFLQRQDQLQQPNQLSSQSQPPQSKIPQTLQPQNQQYQPQLQLTNNINVPYYQAFSYQQQYQFQPPVHQFLSPQPETQSRQRSRNDSLGTNTSSNDSTTNISDPQLNRTHNNYHRSSQTQYFLPAFHQTTYQTQPYVQNQNQSQMFQHPQQLPSQNINDSQTSNLIENNKQQIPSISQFSDTNNQIQYQMPHQSQQLQPYPPPTQLQPQPIDIQQHSSQYQVPPPPFQPQLYQQLPKQSLLPHQQTESVSYQSQPTLQQYQTSSLLPTRLQLPQNIDLNQYPDMTTLINSNTHMILPQVESHFVDFKKCSICGKKITRDMSRHMRTHQFESRFNCKFPKNQCNHKSGKFNRPYDFKKHLLNRHFIFDDPSIKKLHNLNDKINHFGTCPCGMRFLANDWLNLHILTPDLNLRCTYIED
ncbi:hypothetical protein KGF54_000390 [Candida jiufengensis]|uniref:uncharacterized protein n=1 Tax=Candida jiufengensis TaxID=497108 RepID=UPI002225AC78|nr:uncharacterized protein KGF54_000390 [Candida jiufengensis]KAI5956773.1 hypothetical protein KGF54_000390 [Candida jiufengensis]